MKNTHARMMTNLDAIDVVLRHPRVVFNRLRIIASNRHFRREREGWLSRLTGILSQNVRRSIAEVEHDKEFLDAVRDAYRRNTSYFPFPTDFMTEANGRTLFFHCVSLYALIRLVKPQVVVETGGTPGKSSAFILRAMQQNKQGTLYTIDLPPPPTIAALSPGETHAFRPMGLPSNWAVPEILRFLQHLVLGPAQIHLPNLLRQLGQVDAFIHDSDHSHQHMLWELRTAYPFVRSGGYLWADDALANSAWTEFCDEVGLTPCNFTSQGVTLKK